MMSELETFPAEKPQSQNRPGIQSVEVAAVILSALAEKSGSLPLKDLAAAAGMHPGKVHRYLVSLTRTGLVEQDPANAQYSIGPLALKLGLAALHNIDVVRIGSKELPKLRDGIDETVVLSVWGNLGPTVVWIEESGQAVTMNLRIGNVLPVMGTAIGRVFAAYLPASAVKAVMELQPDRVAGAQKSASIDDAENAAILAKVRSKGLARIDGTLMPGVVAFAAPIWDHQGHVVAVVAAIGRREEFDLRWDGDVARALRAMTAGVSQRLGYSE